MRQTMSWREFQSLAKGLLSADTRLWRRFKPANKQTGVNDGG